MPNQLFYGDNLEVMRRHLKDESVDLCYIDPPFNSNRDYFQIYNNIGGEDRAQAQAFTDTWTWDDYAREGLDEILVGKDGRFPSQTIELIRGLKAVLKEGALLAYIISMTLRIVEIHRVLKTTGSFYLHCDPTASHYLKLVLDSVFVTQGGDFKNEIIWHYRRWTGKAKKFQSLHDVIFFYTKSKNYFFDVPFVEYTAGSEERKLQGVLHRFKKGQAPHLVSSGTIDQKGVRANDVWEIPGWLDEAGDYLNELQNFLDAATPDDLWKIPFIAPSAKERLGYPTQKPEALLNRIIRASCPPEGVVLDAYCGCGTTIAVAQALERQWIGIDITYQSIGVILKRLRDYGGKELGPKIVDAVVLNGIPRDMASARALALKKDDRVRKEFEKWAVLTYSRHQAIINAKKGADGGVDGTQFFPAAFGSDEMGKVLYQVKSGGVGRKDIAQMRGEMAREGAQLGVFLTLEEPSAPMKLEAASAGTYKVALMDKNLPVITIATIQDMIEKAEYFVLPVSHLVNKKAVAQSAIETQITLDLGEN